MTDIDRESARFLADARVAEAARARIRRRWLRQQAQEGATFAGALRSLAESGHPVTVRTDDGFTAEGTIVTAGTEGLEVRRTDGARIWIATSSVAEVRSPEALRSGEGEPEAFDGPGPSLLSLLAEAAADKVVIHLRTGSTEVTGPVIGVGVDLVTVRMGTDAVLVPIELVTAAWPES